jgi:hypothetical protein
MEPVTLITTAITLLTPYLVKTGEKIAESIGEDLWNLIKKPFTKKEEEEILSTLNTSEGVEELKNKLLLKITADEEYKKDLQEAVKVAEQKMNSYNQQNINNNSPIEKQVNIQSNTGNIQM